MKRLLLILSCVFLCAHLVFAVADFKMKKNLTVNDGQSYSYSTMSVGGTISIAPKGKVNGSIIVINGTLKLDGEVVEDVIGVGSTITLGENAFVHGDLYLIGGMINPPDKMTVEKKVKGEYLNLKLDLKKIESTLMPIISDSQSLAFFKILKIVFWAILALIVLAIVPRKIVQAQDILEMHLLKTSFIGLVSLFACVFMLFVFVILSIVIVGIPFLIALVVAYLGLYIFGRTVLFYFIGKKLTQQFRLKTITPAWFIIIGVGAYAILKFIPIFGPLLLICMNIFEIGIGVGFLFRKKLHLQG